MLHEINRPVLVLALQDLIDWLGTNDYTILAINVQFHPTDGWTIMVTYEDDMAQDKAQAQLASLRQALREVGLHVEHNGVVLSTAAGTSFRLASLFTPAGKAIATALHER